MSKIVTPISRLIRFKSFKMDSVVCAEKKFRVGGQRSRDSHTLFLSSGELTDVGVFLVLQLNDL